MIDLLAQSTGPSLQQWIIIGALGLALLVVAYQNLRRRPADGDARLHRRELDSANAQTRRIQGDFESLLGELESLSKRITSQVEVEFERLQAILGEADRRIAALRILIEASRQADARSQRGAARPADPSDAAQPSIAQDPRYQEFFRLADQGLSSREIARKLGESTGTVELVLNLRNPQNT